MKLIPRRSPLYLIYAAAFLRSLGIGLTGVVLGVYVARAGFSATVVGVVISAGLAGSAVATLLVSLRADQIGRRGLLLSLSVLSAIGGLAFAFTASLASIVVLAFLGMLNGMGTDRGPLFSLEQAIIPQLISAERRTLSLSWYSVLLDAGHALGALAAALPLFLRLQFHFDLVSAYRITFIFYATLNLLSAVPYSLLGSEVEARRETHEGPVTRPGISSQTKRVIAKLAALSGLDSLGGGLMTDALLAYWFFRRFGIPEQSLGLLFFAGHILNSASYPVAAWLSRKIGLVNTMVFTHIPSSLFLMAVPFAPSPAWAVALFFGREALVEMDVPTRQSYIVAVVQPNERTFASGTSNLTRGIARAVTPSVAGLLMQQVALSTPIFLGGGLKIVYDLMLFAAFRRLKPPEEQA